mgnify:CR=1 FL=1|jgi:hypothetical protein
MRGGRLSGGRVLRGGSWNNNQRNARVSIRNNNTPDNANNNIGFRPVAHVFTNRVPAGNAPGHRQMTRAEAY